MTVYVFYLDGSQGKFEGITRVIYGSGDIVLYAGSPREEWAGQPRLRIPADDIDAMEVDGD